ncbi:hypothetical protein BDL97_18G034200 [Sphagnum fallax]|nr:hypothetical protein BDL97_18G034200 [Sphagnum fallax]
MTTKEEEESPETTEVWDWRDNLESVDTDFPLGFSQALWDELTQNDLDSRLLFATPMSADSLISDPAAALHDALGSQETSVQGTYDDADSQGGSPRPKRRRLFKGTVQSPSNSDPAAFQEMLAPFKSDAVDCLLPELDEQENSISIPSIWYKDESQSSLADNVEPMAESWMITCIEDNGNNSCVSQMETTALVTETPELWTPSRQPCEDPAVLQGPATPFSSRPSTPGNRVSAVRKLNMSAPVAYPFTMVKPLGTEGDVTLTDINQLIATPPKVAALHQGQVSADVRPSSSKSESGVGLSGKSVVARTRICTEGNGTITILRTKG